MKIRKVDFVLILLMFMVIIGGCSSSTLNSTQPLEQSTYGPKVAHEKIKLTVNEKNITKDVASLTLTYTNDSDQEYYYGVEPHLEIKIEEKWYVVPTVEDFAWIEIAYILAPHSSTQETIDIQTIYGQLNAGEYRWIKNLYSEGETLTLFAEFTIHN